MNTIKTISNKVTLFLLLFLFPVLVSAADPGKFLLDRIGSWIGLATPIVGGLALLIFILGIVKFIWHGGDEEKRKEGKKFMLWSIIALFVMVSIWGIITFLEDAIYEGGSGSVPGSIGAPCLGGVPGSECEGGSTPPPPGQPPGLPPGPPAGCEPGSPAYPECLGF